MMRTRTTVAGLFAVAAAAAFPMMPAVAADRIVSSYEVEIAGVTVLNIKLDANVDDDSYNATLQAKTKGMASLFTNMELKARSGGKVGMQGLVPGSFSLKRKSGDRTREVDLSWDNKGVANVDDTFKPDGLKRLNSALATGSIDPLTVLLSISLAGDRHPCNGTYRTYDGRDLYDMTFNPKGGVSDVSTSDAKQECNIAATSVAGKDFEKALPGKADPSNYRAVFQSYDAAGGQLKLHVPVRVTGKIEGQNFKARIKSLSVNGQKIIN